MNGKSFIYGVLIGGTIAGVSALLTTAESGASRRAKIKSTAQSIQLTIEDLKQEAIHIKDQVTQAMEEGKATVGNIAEEIKVSVDLWQNSIKPHQESIQQNIANLQEELEKLEKKLAKNTAE